MKKPIIYLNETLRKEQVEQIRSVAKGYAVIDSVKSDKVVEEDRIEILLGWDKQLGQRLLDSSTSKLKWVQSISAGVDTYDLSRFKEKRILLSNTSGLHSTSISEHVIGVLLTEFRGLRISVKNQLQHKWQQNIPYQQLADKKMLVVGTGHIGQELAYKATNLGVQAYGINTSGHITSGFIECYSRKKMINVVNEMDIVVNILPLTDDTYHLYNDYFFNKMKKEAIFINVGRGASVNTLDLIEALKNGPLSFAALDVFENEPLAEDSPLWSMENVLLTPHISGLTPNFKTLLMAIFLPNLESFITTQTLKLNQVSLSQGY